jgi:hypothetical protein
MPRKNRIALTALIAALLMMAAESSRAEIYKWVDPDGRVTYSNTPMPGSVTMDTLPAPSEEDVRAAREEFERVEALGADMEKRRLALEEQRARLDMEERVWTAYLQQSRAPTPGYDMPWAYIIDAGAHRQRAHRSLLMRDGHGHESPVRMHVGMDRRPQP